MDYTLDLETMNLVIQMQLEDAQSILKGKYSDGGDAPDGELAAQLFKNELEALEQFYFDQAMSRSIAQAVVHDAELIQESMGYEEQVAHDREYAIACENGTPYAMPERDVQENSPDVIDEDMMEKLISLYIGDRKTVQTPDHTGSSSRTGGAETPKQTDARRRCIACLEDFLYTDTIRASD
ncbi:hypothetical protein NLG97_g7434 [Lecanicillium saksenae]|uniref:Uncharacterized protein n=1 Tax=Lecanicillium saksenae TaxID=468837 RepID=A0ACC1QLT8_9HYPO|nr:hypothetical protein NLG97_g7434 [Lecanicillium saksenae]